MPEDEEGAAVPAVALGVILPSSNRVVERATEARLSGRADAAACYARVPYHAMTRRGSPAYDEAVFLDAAHLLADAGVAAIGWNATRGAALGFRPDERLCERLGRRTGLPVVTTALAARDRIRRAGHARVGLLVQGGADEVHLVRGRFADAGVALGPAAGLGVSENRLAAFVPPARLAEAAGALAREGADAVLVWSTNLPGWRLPAVVAGLPLLDATTIGTDALLAAAGLPAPP
ncbi:Maleate isomerase [Methylobacterium crusticola]|uniref:Maleate isomerase n=1 Tax=Methylobacterium crusticola TaxID=1697972 RepID=A0ABQ4R1V2_9HYPH|nr:aspartate/glutamate racemase family protein [Methylobacterium crusticola]GJD51407.1 Maleate isomerase [Methylobacterium crusticola]